MVIHRVKHWPNGKPGMLYFQPTGVVGRGSETQLQVVEKTDHLIPGGEHGFSYQTLFSNLIKRTCLIPQIKRQVLFIILIPVCQYNTM